MSIEALYDKHDAEYCKFDRVQNKRSNRPDLHAFLLLDSLVPGNIDMVSAAEHDEIFLDVNISELEGKITEEQVVELIRCGIRYCSEYDCLGCFV